jgi:hypothetical protein
MQLSSLAPKVILSTQDERLWQISSAMKPQCELERYFFRGPDLSGVPPPPKPHSQDQKEPQTEATTFRSPGRVDRPGFFFVAVNAPF